MKYRVFGRTGLKISEIGFGAWAIGGTAWGQQDDDESIAALRKAIELGVNFIDTAAGYGDGHSEEVIAKVLNDYSEKIYVATKIPPASGPWPPSPYCNMEERYSETYLRKRLEERLRFLQTDCIDIIQLHTWTRAWNKHPQPFELLRKFQKEGKLNYIGVSTPEHDQNSVIDLMRAGYLDVVQVIYNIFEQEPVAELLPTAAEYNVALIGRVAFDEGVLTGKFSADTTFEENDFRNRYFAGDRLERAVKMVEEIRKDTKDSGFTLPQLALKFVLARPEISTVIPGIRNVRQAAANIEVSELPDLSDELLKSLQKYNWLRAFWYSGK